MHSIDLIAHRPSPIAHRPPVLFRGTIFLRPPLSHLSHPACVCGFLRSFRPLRRTHVGSLAAFQTADKHTLVLVRHGESTWNLENKFTGWVDVPLSPKGHEEVIEAGRLIKEAGLQPDVAFTSLQKRAIRTLWHVLEETDRMWIPVTKAWQLNERHYGALQGLDKQETVDKYGKDQVLVWRRSYDVPPPVVDRSSEHHPGNDPR